MGLLNRKDLLKRDNLKIEKVELENGDFVFVKQMTGRERDSFERSLLKETKDDRGRIDYQSSMEDFRAKIAVMTVCDENGNLLLQPSDYAMLSENISAAKLELIINKAQTINKISQEDKEALIKNSDAGVPGDYSSDSV